MLMGRWHRKAGVLALFTIGPCNDNTSEATSTRTRASSHLLCGHRRSIVSLSSRRVSFSFAVHDSTCVVGLCIRRAPSTDGEGNMESCWDRVKYILRSAGCAPCDGDTHSHSFFFVHEGMLGPSSCSKLRTEQSTWQNSDSLCLYVLFMCVGGFSTIHRPRFSVLFLRDKKPFVRKSGTEYSDTVQAPSLQYHHTCHSFCKWKSSCSEQDEMIQHLMSAC